MLEQDWMMRQIETMTLSLARFVFGKESADYTPSGLEQDGEVDALALRLTLLIDGGQLNEGENLLFEAMEGGDRKAFELAVDFYSRINQLTDEKLKAAGFSRKEIEEGVQDAMEQFGVVLP